MIGHPKPEKKWRSDKYRRLVASMPCISCGIEGRTQAAHLNLIELGKGRGTKVSDAFCIPLCADTFGARGCHSRLDQGGIYDRQTAAALQWRWLQDFRTNMQRRRLWPAEAERQVLPFVREYLERAA